MKVIILAGGMGTRLAEETEIRPKPMVEIGGRPILWHIMKHFSHYGINDFLIALGYKGEVIKRYFLDYAALNGSLMVDLGAGKVEREKQVAEPWQVNLVETGLNTQTGGRVKRLQSYIGGQTFMLTYGDGVSNVNLADLLAFHRSRGKLVTLTAVRPPARFGGLQFNGDLVSYFIEKPQIGEGWINGGFFVLEPGIKKYIEGDHTAWEFESLEQLAAEGQVSAFQHYDFWQCMDTVRDVHLLDKLWQEGNAPWKIW